MKIVIDGYDNIRNEEVTFEFESPFLPKPGDVVIGKHGRKWHVGSRATFHLGDGYVRLGAECFE